MASDLTPLQESFIEHYMRTLNATEAARLAGYAGDAPTLAVQGYQVLRSINVAPRIKEALRQRAMPVEEIVARLSDIASAGIEDIGDVDEATGRFHVDLRKTKRVGRGHVVKGVKYSGMGQMEVTLHDSILALDKLARIHRMFGEEGGGTTINQLNINLTPEQRKERLAELLQIADTNADNSREG